MTLKPDALESLLTDYERRKQDETRRMVQRAFKLENARKKGAEHLRRYALPHAREVAKDRRGVVVPAFALNNLLSNVPLLGPLLTGGKDGGVFAISYRLDGPFDDLKLNIKSAYS